MHRRSLKACWWGKLCSYWEEAVLLASFCFQCKDAHDHSLRQTFGMVGLLSLCPLTLTADCRSPLVVEVKWNGMTQLHITDAAVIMLSHAA